MKLVGYPLSYTRMINIVYLLYVHLYTGRIITYTNLNDYLDRTITLCSHDVLPFL